MDACISLLRDSPFWEGALLSQAEVSSCWRDLLSTGIGLIDIVEPRQAGYMLKKPGRDDSHYKNGFACTTFVCYVTSDFARELVLRKDDKEDPLLRLTRRHGDFLKGRSRTSPIPELGKGGKIILHNGGFYGLSVAVFHPAILRRWDFFKLLSPFFTRRIDATMRQNNDGFKHEAWFNLAAGDHLKEAYESFGGNALVRPYPGNDSKPPENRKYIFAIAKDEAVCGDLGLPLSCRPKGSSVTYECLFWNGIHERRAHLDRDMQHLCYLLLIGFRLQHIEARLSCDVQRLMARTLDQLQREYDDQPQARKFRPGELPETLIALIEDAPHEIREFIFPAYPWPQNLSSRRK
ncbi:MAG TPA: hypothetical protein VHE55_06105 [Fimbriimonadaceae bacterium]|nr:hypothetical protein [Fimbriimonadaceae bacterium]